MFVKTISILNGTSIFHDHIIRNNLEYQRIKGYIISNPLKWNNDKFNPSNNNVEK